MVRGVILRSLRSVWRVRRVRTAWIEIVIWRAAVRLSTIVWTAEDLIG